MTGNFTNVIIFVANSTANFFTAIDAVKFPDTNFSILDMFVGIMFLDLVTWFVMKVIRPKEKE